MVDLDNKTNSYKKQHTFENLGTNEGGKNALIFDGERVVAVRYTSKNL